MTAIGEQVRRARRRLITQQFLSVVVWSLFATLLVAAVAIAVPKIWALPTNGLIWTWSWLGGAFACGLIIAVVATFIIRRSSLDAAIEIDRRFGLKERVSSSLLLSQEERKSSFGHALMTDAQRRVDRIDVSERFRVKGNWISLLPLVPIIVAAILLLVPDAVPPAGSQADASTLDNQRKQIKNSTKKLQERLAERRKKAEEVGLKEAGDLFKKIEAGVGNLSRQDEKDPKKAMAKLNDLSDELEKRRQELGSRDQIRNQLNSLKDLKQGPADRLARAVKDGDFGKALQELKQLQEKLRDGSLSDQQKEALAEQLDQMAEKLRQLADAHEQAKRELQEEIDRRMKNGDLAGAGELQRKLDQLNRQNAQMDRLRQMANQLGQCAECTKGGDGLKAAQQLDQLASELQQMQQELEELEMLEDAMSQIADAKDAMNCANCNGMGCAMCMSQGFGMGMNGMNGMPGMGMGEGQGQGARPEQETDKNFYDSQVRAQIRRGQAVAVGSVAGKNIAGDAREEIKAAIESTKTTSDDPLVGQRIPRQHRDQVEQYFEAFRGGD